ncbi:MAG: hypothetical protein HQL33_01220 [Alphaproteobacteria bacterium]|nr:hypothetical protein [Alphaproteobacteria bacterium]
MSTIGPPVGPPPPPPLPPGLAQILAAAIPDPPPALLKLPQGALFDVSVLLGNSTSNLDVAGETGTFSLRGGGLAVEVGSKLTLQVTQTGPQVQVRVLAVNNQPLQSLLQGAAGKDASGVALPQAGGSQMGVGQMGAGQIGAGWGGAVNMPGGSAVLAAMGGVGPGASGIAATVVHGAPPPAQGGAVPIPGQLSGGGGIGGMLPTGTQLVVRIASVQFPGQPAAPGQAQVSAQAPTQTPGQVSGQASVPVPGQPQAGAQATASSPAPQTAASPAPPAVTPPASGGLPASSPSAPVPAGGQGVVPPPAVAAPPALAGVVAANTMGSQTIVQTPAGMLALSTRAELPPGTMMSLEIVSQTPPQAPAAPVGAPPLPPLTGGQGWPALNEALTVLQRMDPAAAGQLNALIPSIGPRLTAAMIAAGAGIRLGDARVWPGESTLKALERSGSRGAALAKKLGQDVAEMGERAKEPGGASEDGWRVTPMPFQNGQAIEKITLSVHRPPDEEEDGGRKGGKGGTRFLLDLNLSRMGPVQIDGLVRAGERRFDLVLRTREALSQQVKRDLVGLFAASSLAMNMSGGLSFQVTPRFVVPGPSAESPGGRGGSQFGVVV